MRVVVYDSSTHAGWVGNTWILGGRIYRAFGSVDVVIPVPDWSTFFSSIHRLSGITDLQVWTHGAPGIVAIGGVAMDSERFTDHNQLSDISCSMHPHGRFWLRTCSSFAGAPGHELASVLSEELGVKVVGHTYEINFFQSGLHSLYPGQAPYWSVKEGLGNDRLLVSHPFARNTITCLNSNFPDAW